MINHCFDFLRRFIGTIGFLLAIIAIVLSFHFSEQASNARLRASCRAVMEVKEALAPLSRPIDPKDYNALPDLAKFIEVTNAGRAKVIADLNAAPTCRIK